MVRDEDLARRLVIRRGTGGNCTYDESARQELIEACLRGERSVAKFARAYGLNSNQLHNWIALYQKAQASVPRPSPTTVADVASPFIPVVTIPVVEEAPELRLHIILANGIRAELSPPSP